MLVLGGREKEKGTVSLRARDGQTKNDLTVKEFTDFVLQKVKNKETL